MKELKKLDVAGSATDREKSKDFFVQWHLTERCNLACRHCYQTGGGGGGPDLTVIGETASEVSEMIEGWAERYGISFSPSFNVTGGEPLLLPEIFEILAILREQRFQTYLLTNGTLLTAEKAKRLSALVDGVQISIEGPEPVHDRIRGKGSFRRALRGVENLLAEQVYVDLNVTLSALNAGYLEDLLSLGLSLGVPRIGFSRLVPYGRGKALVREMLSADEVHTAYRRLLDFKDERMKTGTGDPLAAWAGGAANGDSGDVPVGGCAAAVSGLTLLPDGTITPCRRLPLPIGNIRRDSIREIWAESPVLNMLRDREQYTGKCRTCSHWADCRGCRAIAYAWARSRGSEDFLADDPQCFI